MQRGEGGRQGGAAEDRRRRNLPERRRRPRVIVCGASAYPRVIDFAAFRRIADDVGAFLLADISHIAGLVVAGLHPSPIEHAHIVTTSTYKQLYGPRGGLILMGRDADTKVGRRTLAQTIQSAVFPQLQGTPSIGAIAAKARALELVAQPAFHALARKILDDARALAAEFAERGYSLVTGGTDNHMVLVDVAARGLTGAVAEQALESCGLIVNRNAIPGDPYPPRVASGIRLGTNSLALRGMEPADMAACAALVDRVLDAVAPTGESTYTIDEAVQRHARSDVERLCQMYPLPGLFPTGELLPA
ncbi:MAG: serine hydroxymethyltransferase [Micromonosporaceae bacterium]